MIVFEIIENIMSQIYFFALYMTDILDIHFFMTFDTFNEEKLLLKNQIKIK